MEPLHTISYFAPEPTQAYVQLGLHRQLSYFAARSAALGPAGPGLTTATFFVFAPDLVAMALPAAWSIATPAQVQQARRDGIGAALRRILGDADVGEALELARIATDGLGAAGRPLYAAHAGLDWPEDPLVALWHAATLIREHRGDAHVAVLTTAGLDPVTALVLAGPFSHNTDFLRRTRGWSEQQWTETASRLTRQGLLEADGTLTAQGTQFRQRLEDQTDRLATAAFDHLGAERTERLIELFTPLRRAVLASGDLPDWLVSRG